MAITYEAGVNLLQGTVGTLNYQAGVGDTGVLSTFATAVIINLDKVSIKRSATTADHGGGQNPEEIHRINKYVTQVDVEMKLYADATAPLFIPGLQVQIVVVGTVGAHTVTVTVQGIITDLDIEFAGPSTYKFSMKPYAVGGASSFVIAYA